MTRRAFSLIEAALVMGVVGVVIGGVWMGLSSIRNAAMDKTFLQQTMTTVQNVRTYFATRPLPSTAADASTNYTDAVMRAAKVFPEDTCSGNCIVDAAATARTVFGSTMKFSLPLLGAFPQPNKFRISVFSSSGFTRAHCLAWAIALGAQADTIGLLSIDSVTSFPLNPAIVGVSAKPAPICDDEMTAYTLTFKIRM